jgi:hypothetical protein
MRTPDMIYSPYTDPELRDWLRWASESHEVPMFVRTIAEAAFLADLRNYAQLRPVLREVKRQYPRPTIVERIRSVVADDFPHYSVVFDEDAWPMVRFRIQDMSGTMLSRACPPFELWELEGLTKDDLRSMIRRLCGSPN